MFTFSQVSRARRLFLKAMSGQIMERKALIGTSRPSRSIIPPQQLTHRQLLEQGRNILQSICNDEEEIETWILEAHFFLEGFRVFCFVFQGKKILVKIERNPAKKKFHIRWRLFSFQEGVRAAKKH